MTSLNYSINQITVDDVVEVVKCSKDHDLTIQEMVDVDNALSLLKKHNGSFAMKEPFISLEREGDFIILSV